MIQRSLLATALWSALASRALGHEFIDLFYTFIIYWHECAFLPLGSKNPNHFCKSQVGSPIIDSKFLQSDLCPNFNFIDSFACW